jgi:hypothetical protein
MRGHQPQPSEQRGGEGDRAVRRAQDEAVGLFEEASGTRLGMLASLAGRKNSEIDSWTKAIT